MLVSKYLYVVSTTASSVVSMFSINERTGMLTPLNPPSVAAGNISGFIKSDPNGQFAFVDDVGTNVYTYSINPASGVLTQVAVTPNGPNSNAFLVDPQSRFAYGTSNGSTTINIYAYNAATGAVTSIGSANNAGATATQQTILDSQGRYLYTSNQTGPNVSQFSVDQATGALTSLGAPIVSTQPGAICIGPQDRYLYAPNTGGANIAAFSIAANGALASLGTTPTPASTFYCATTPDGSYLLATGAAIYVMPIGANGLPGTPSSFGAAPNSVGLDSTGQFVYAASAGATSVDVYRMTAGTLTLLQTVSAPTGTSELKVLNRYSY